MSALQAWCPHCVRPIEVPLPVEPLYSLPSAALLVPCSQTGIRQLLSRHRDKLLPAVYRRHPSNPKLRIRFLYASDLVVLRGLLFSGERFKRKKKPVVAP